VVGPKRRGDLFRRAAPVERCAGRRRLSREVTPVKRASLIGPPAPLELLERECPHEVEESESGFPRLTSHEACADELVELYARWATRDRVKRIRAEPAPKDRRASQHFLCGCGEQLVTPADRRLERPLAVR
jgi:hypothetical protein